MVSLKDTICHLPTANPFYPVYLAKYKDNLLQDIISGAKIPTNAAERWLRSRSAKLLSEREKLNNLTLNYQSLNNNTVSKVFTGADPIPYHIWCQGVLHKPPYLVIVGPRKPSDYAKNVVREWVKNIAPYCTIVSGLAHGLDAVALESAVEVGGKTVAIVPTGLSKIYPAANRILAQKIVKQGGCVMSELIYCDFVSKPHFLMRNRLMAAMADLVWVPEAAFKSGTITTALMAVKMGKTVAVLPGEIDRFTAEGSNMLLRDGAHCLCSLDDLISLLKIESAIKVRGLQKFQSIIKCISQGFDTPDKIVQELAVDPSIILKQLTQAKESGYIVENINGSYSEKTVK